MTRKPLSYTFEMAEKARRARIANGDDVPETIWERRARLNGFDQRAGLRPEPNFRERRIAAARRG